ncbi:MAG TPA: GNAT family N-acyltransferase [Methylomusa anaerophila]|uniref:Cyclic nucleotide-binding domain-containing protein n=1 Tax=Methylomusa anaerophila TaxID=1930071 RepID=A0A348ANE7_9FIRM|nr:GNAT family N-acyltransferase [Methylomusa anaerophila]BBB92595.1 hypothetical protein MAMMFC1_03290 [Methylomusa anaerophila]HML87551.1 GNAT family N-acyltransferase [Methylomusa anaerophila]
MENVTQAVSLSPAGAPTERIIIGEATTAKERREIYRLRYHVYAEEIGYKFVTADHVNKLLQDELDEKALLLYAKVGSKIIGTGRVNIGRLADFSPDLIQTYRMDKFKKFHSEENDPYFAVASKGMILPEYRNSSAIYRIIAKLYELYCDYRIQFAFINCNFHLIPFYERSGYVRIDKNTVDSNDGSPLTSLVLAVDDVQHLQRVGSPLFRIARGRTSLNTEVVNRFNSVFFSEMKTPAINSQLITVDELWSIICRHLGNAPNQTIDIMNDLSILEAKFFLHSCSTIVHCHAGDHIAVSGNTSQELIILLAGTAQSSLHGTILPGQYCGENGLAHRSRHFSSVIALDEADILVFSFFLFSNFQKRHPNIARKILNNLQQNYYPNSHRMVSRGS